MQVGQISEEVTVEANAELVGTRNGTLGQLVDQKRVVELPLNGRMAQSLVFLAAGTVDLDAMAAASAATAASTPASKPPA